MATKRIHMCQSVRGALNNWKYPDDYYGVFQREDGTYLNPVQARDYLYDCLAEGKEKLPLDPSCDNFDYQHGCQGHDVPEEAAESDHAQD